MTRFELSEEDFQMLVFFLGLAGGAASRDGKTALAEKSMAMTNDLIAQKKDEED